MRVRKVKKKYNKIVIGIDQSYTRTGISIAVDGELKVVSSIDYKGLSSRAEKRNALRGTLGIIISKNAHKANEVVILCERVRTFSKSFGKKGSANQDNAGGMGLNPGYLKMTGALVATIVDVAFEYGVNVYSVDTRSWKSKIVGNSKARIRNGKRDAKSETVNFVQGLGFDLFVREKKVGKNKGERLYNDDAADSACISLYGFIPKNQQKLVLEQ